MRDGNRDSLTIERGREAWARIDGGATWTDWLAVGEALEVGRREAMARASVNEPLGRGYNEAFGSWLRENGFDGIDKSSRSRLFAVMDNLAEITAWRETLPSNMRRELNHPTAVLRKWKSSTVAPKPASEKKPTMRDENIRLTEENDALRKAAARGDGAVNDVEADELRDENARLQRQVDLLQSTTPAFDPADDATKIAKAIFDALGPKLDKVLPELERIYRRAVNGGVETEAAKNRPAKVVEASAAKTAKANAAKPVATKPAVKSAAKKQTMSKVERAEHAEFQKTCDEMGGDLTAALFGGKRAKTPKPAAKPRRLFGDE